METRTHAPASPATAGNGARDVLITYMGLYLGSHMGVADSNPEAATDHLLAWLWREGFKVSPLEAHENESDTGKD